MGTSKFFSELNLFLNELKQKHKVKLEELYKPLKVVTMSPQHSPGSIQLKKPSSQ